MMVRSDRWKETINSFFKGGYIAPAFIIVLIHFFLAPVPWLFHSVSEQNNFGLLLAFCILMDGSLAAWGDDNGRIRRYGMRHTVRSILQYGGVDLQDKRTVRRVLLGALTGIIIWVVHVMTISYIYDTGLEVDYHLPLIILLFIPAKAFAMYLVAPFFEEVLFRGFLITRLITMMGDTTRTHVLSGSISAILFAAMHPLHPVHKLIPGVALAILVLAPNKKERTLVPAIVAHIVVNILFSIAWIPID